MFKDFTIGGPVVLLLVLIVLVIVQRLAKKGLDIYALIKEERRKDAEEKRKEAAEVREQRRFEHEVSEWGKPAQKDSSSSVPKKPRTPKKSRGYTKKIAL